MKTKTALLITGMVLLLFVSGCEASAAVQDSGQEETAVQEEELPESFSYHFAPHVISAEYIRIYGPDIEKEFYALCDALLKGDDSFICPSRERAFQLLSITNYCFPLANGLIDKDTIACKNGSCSFDYLDPAEERAEKTAAFRQKVTDVITAAIPYEVPEEIMAMELYTAVAHKNSYDHSYTLDDSLAISSYRTVMNDIGICQELSGEYIYYLLQVGIDAIPCSSLNSDRSEAHEWVLARFGDKYYHIDPTYALEYPDSLYFFGMDDIQREYYGDLPRENYVYADADSSDNETYAAEDRRFQRYWLAQSYEIDPFHKKITVKELDTGTIHEYDFD